MKPSALILTNVFVLALLPTLSCRPKQLKPEEPILVSASDLLADYLAVPPDRVKQLRYNDRQLRVTGVIARVKSAEALVILKGKEDSTTFNGLHCNLFRGNEDFHEIYRQLSQLSEGQVVVVEGHNLGFEFGFVELGPCSIKEY